MFLFLTNFMRLMSVGSALLMTSSVTHAFVSPNAFVNTRIQNEAIDFSSGSTYHPTLLKMTPFDTVAESSLSTATSLLLSDEAQIVSVATSSLELLKNAALIVVGLLLGGGLFTYIVATFVVPKAAEQLERDTKRLRPDLWAEYEAKLQPGESFVTRPDLLQELGNIMQPIIMADFDANAGGGGGNEANVDVVGSSQSVSESVQGDVIEGEILDDNRPGKTDGTKSAGWGSANQWDD